MTTLATLADSIQDILSDAAAAKWTQTVIEAWVNQGIQDYTEHFTRKKSATISTTADDRTYDLPSDFRDIITVEYPTASDPPEYLAQLTYKHPDFWNSTDYYNIIKLEDDNDTAELWISKKPAAAETITVWYEANHDYALASGDTVTVPAAHHPILVAYVTWIASQNLQHAEQQSPTSNSSLLMSQFASNSDRLRRAHVEILAKALRSEEGQSRVINWVASGGDKSISRIY